ncbi:MAG: hypothetical protein NW226_12305 [Microscillaceae bacterium]|nr:hypothetical protein [Microscillaceae bacterium]
MSQKRINNLTNELEEIEQVLHELERARIYVPDSNPTEKIRLEKQIEEKKKIRESLGKELEKEYNKKPLSLITQAKKKKKFYTSPFFIIAGVFVLGIVGVLLFYPKCFNQEAKIIIQVADFVENKKNDLFSKNLVIGINSLLENANISKSMAYAYGIEKHIESNQKPLNLEKSIKKYTKKYCNYSGIFIYGNRDVVGIDSLFYCKIRFTNLDILSGNINLASSNPSGNKSSTNIQELDIRDPENVDFSIREQASLVAEFVQATIHYYKKDYLKTAEMLKECATRLDSNNKKYVFYCYFFQGNSYTKIGNYTLAKEAYKKANRLIPGDTLLLQNLQGVEDELDKLKEKPAIVSTKIEIHKGTVDSLKWDEQGRLTESSAIILDSIIGFLGKNIDYRLMLGSDTITLKVLNQYKENRMIGFNKRASSTRFSFVKDNNTGKKQTNIVVAPPKPENQNVSNRDNSPVVISSKMMIARSLFKPNESDLLINYLEALDDSIPLFPQKEFIINGHSVNRIGNSLNNLIYVKDQLKKLEMKQCGLSLVPEVVFKLDQLTTLDISNNQISQISPSIDRLSNLEKLFLINNKPLADLPENIMKLIKLKKLYISGTSLHKSEKSLDFLFKLLRAMPANFELYADGEQKQALKNRNKKEYKSLENKIK